jgi:hypothetical protein
MGLNLVAMALRELSYSDMENLAYGLCLAVQSRKEDGEMDWEDDNYQHWMELLQCWAEGKLDE